MASLRQMNGTGSETIPGASGSIRSDAKIKPIFQTSDQVEKGRSATTRTRATDCTHPKTAHELGKIRAIATGTRQNEQTLPLRIIPTKHRRHGQDAVMPNQNDHWSGERSIKKTCFIDHFVAQSPAQEVYQNRTKPNQDARQNRKLVYARRCVNMGGQIQIVRPWSEESSLPSSGITASVIQQLLNSPSLCLESTKT